jgi:hypothetical protein
VVARAVEVGLVRPPVVALVVAEVTVRLERRGRADRETLVALVTETTQEEVVVGQVRQERLRPQHKAEMEELVHQAQYLEQR